MSEKAIQLHDERLNVLTVERDQLQAALDWYSTWVNRSGLDIRFPVALAPVLEASLRRVTPPTAPSTDCNHAAHLAYGPSACPDCIAATAMAELAAQAQALDLGYQTSSAKATGIAP